MAVAVRDMWILHCLRQIAPLVTIGILRDDAIQVRLANFLPGRIVLISELLLGREGS